MQNNLINTNLLALCYFYTFRPSIGVWLIHLHSHIFCWFGCENVSIVPHKDDPLRVETCWSNTVLIKERK